MPTMGKRSGAKKKIDFRYNFDMLSMHTQFFFFMKFLGFEMSMVMIWKDFFFPFFFIETLIRVPFE